jgi:hypothetical protein
MGLSTNIHYSIRIMRRRVVLHGFTWKMDASFRCGTSNLMKGETLAEGPYSCNQTVSFPLNLTTIRITPFFCANNAYFRILINVHSCNVALCYPPSFSHSQVTTILKENHLTDMWGLFGKEQNNTV